MDTTMKHFLLTLLILVSAATCGRAFDRVSGHIGLRDGLSDNFVTAIAQDGYGFLWFATDNGLNRFDGERIIVFSEKNKSLKGNSVNTLYYDDISGHMWVGSKKGIDIIDCRTLQSAGPDIPRELSTQSMAGFAPDGEKGIYILANYGYIGYYDRAADSCRIYRETDFPGLIMSMQAAASDSEGRLIAGQENYGLSIVDLRDSTFENFMHDPRLSQSLPGNNVNAVLMSRDGDLIAATDHGLCRFDTKTRLFEPAKAADTRGNSIGKGNIISLAELADGTILASDSEVLFQDSFGNIWIGTRGNGIEFIPADPPLFGRISTDRRPAGAFIAGRDGLLAGLGDGIVSIADMDTEPLYALSPYIHSKNAVIAAMTRIDGGLLVSVAGEGIFLTDESSGKVSPVATPYEKDYATTIVHAPDGRILLGTQHGLYEYDNGQFRRNEKVSAAIGYLIPNGIVTDRRGRLWIGTYGNGIFVFDRDYALVTHITSDDGLASNAVKQLLVDSRQWIWMAGQDGVSVIRDISNPGRIENFNYENGLADISIRSLSEDREGNIWMASNNILCRYNAEGDSIESFGSRFKTTESSFIDRAAATGPDGRMFFGALDGIYSFRPEAFDRRRIDVPLRIVGYSFTTAGSPAHADTEMHYNTGARIDLPRGCRSVRILVSVPDFSLRGKASYSYTVEGLSDRWMPLPDGHEIVLNEMKPGEYFLKIRTDEVFGHRTGDGTAGIRISVPSPWWMAWWAIAVYAVLGAALAYGTVSLFHKRTITTTKADGKNLPEEAATAQNGADTMSRVDKEFLDRFTSLVEQNIGRPDLDMEFFQTALNMSHSTLYRRLKNLTGMSGNELIKKCRLKKGREMLMQGFSVSETAYACGFSDPGYFRACFKNEYGKAPSEIRPGN